MSVIVKEKRISPNHSIALPDDAEDGNVLVYEADTETWEAAETAPPGVHTHAGEDVTSAVAEADHASAADDADTVGGESPEAFADAVHVHALADLDVSGASEGALLQVLIDKGETNVYVGPVAAAKPTENAVPVADGSGKLDTGWLPSLDFIPLPESAFEGDSLRYDGEEWVASSALSAPSAPTIDSSTGSGGIITVLASSGEENVDGYELVHDPAGDTDPDTLSPVFSSTGVFEFPAKESLYLWIRAVRGDAKSDWTTNLLFSTEYNEDPISGVEGADVAGMSHQGAGNKLIYTSASPAPPGESMYITSHTSQQVRSYDIWTVASGIAVSEYGFKLTTSNHWLNSNYTNRVCGVLFGARSEIFTTFATETFYLCYLLHNGASSTVACLSSFVGTTETNIYTSSNIFSSASIQLNGWNDVIVERNGENITMHVNGVKVLDQTPSTIPASSSRIHIGLVHNGNNTISLPYGNLMLLEVRNSATTAVAPGKVADADLLDGHDTSYFATADHTQALAKGGTNADLSATGGTGQVLRQSSTGANVTVSSLKLTETAAGDNNTWTKFTDFAGTGEVNALKLNASDELEVGAPINLPGPIDFPADAGVVTLCDMPVVSAVDETLMKVAMKIAGQVVAAILGYSTGSGAIDKLALQIVGDLLPSTTNVSALGSATLAFKELHLSDGANEWKITVDTGGNLVSTAE